MPYCKQCGAELPEDARFCPKCGSSVSYEAKPLETHKTLKVAGKPKVIVTNVAPGSIEVKSGSDAEVTVDLDLRIPEDLDCSIQQDGNIITVTSRMKFHPFCWPAYIFRMGSRANIVLAVPSETDLTLENRFGRVIVTSVKGTLTVESSTGTVSVKDCEGAVKAKMETGSVDLENVNGTVFVRNITGSISFAGALSKGENWFETSTGNIELMLKGEPDLTIEASTRLGRVACSPELTDARYERGLYTGRIGAGTEKLIIETKIGNIKIRH